MSTTPLRDLVEDRIAGRWAEWAAAHPNLAEAIDRTRLIDASVDKLREDPQFIDAMRRADLDDNALLAVARLLEHVDRWILHLLPL